MSEQHDQERINETEWENPANWRYGLFYRSERDSRIWVPKRSMFGRRRYGGTPNFAKKSARQYMMLVVGLALVLFLFVVALERLGVLG
jgi:uncharacterized membrane protein